MERISKSGGVGMGGTPRMGWRARDGVGRRKDATSVVQKIHTSVSFISCVHVGAVLVRPRDGRSQHPLPSCNVPFKIVQSENSHPHTPSLQGVRQT